MILENKIKVKINPKTLKYYRNLGVECKVNDILDVDINFLQKGSHMKINVKCDICGKEKKISYRDYNKNISTGKYYACTSKCAKKKIIENNNKKYNVNNVSKLENVKEKRKKTKFEKYGDANFNNREKYKETCLKKYNVDNVSKLNKIKNKIKKTNIFKFGHEYYTMSPNYKKEFNNVCLKKYGETNYTKSKYFKEKILDKIKKRFNINIIKYENNILYVKCEKNHIFETTEHNLYQRIKLYETEVCTICNPLNSFSGKEEEMLFFIKDNYHEDIIINNRSVIHPYELDIYLPKLKIALEFNGLYWHNELYKDKNYHLNKTEECEKQGIQLIHIYEDDWIYKQDIVKSMILNKLNKTPNKIYARKTEIKEITNNKLVREFLDKNHIQGFIGSKIKLGLFYNNELVSLMTFCNRRVSMIKKSTNEGEYELLSFCNKLNTNVIGGSSKLFKYFINKYQPKEITTCADRSYSQGKLYKTIGFKFEGKTQPNYYYIIDGIRKHRFNFRKDKLIKEGFDTNKTEQEIMLDRKIYKIHDSGNLKFKINI